MILLWETFAEREPKLEELRQELVNAAVPGETPFCKEAFWYGKVKPRLVRLIGRQAEDERMRSENGYALAYHTLYGLVRNCDHEGDCWREPISEEADVE